MDLTGLLAAVLAVAVYPGVLYLLVAAALHRLCWGRRANDWAASAIPTGVLAPLVASVGAAALLPLSGSPALRLPPGSGVGGNLAAIVVLLAIAWGCTSSARSAQACAALGGAAALALASGVRSLSVLAIVGAPGTPSTARLLAAVPLLVAAALPPAPPTRTGSVVRAATALAGASLILPALGDLPAVVGAVLGLVVVAATGLAGRALDIAPLRGRFAVAASLLAAVSGGALGLFAGRV